MHFLLQEPYLSKTRPPFMFLKENHRHLNRLIAVHTGSVWLVKQTLQIIPNSHSK